ncbi:MAG TPA: hypothetical protein VMX75_16315 [Spirochaetia bacterium]|nr:hypothetical protein [Spirochaetia bacterium]
MTLLIGLITFALGCFITYYLDRSIRKTSNTSGTELREELRRQRRTIQELQTHTLSLLKIALKTAVDTAAERLKESPVSPSEKSQMYSSAYEAIKGRWLEESESLDLDGTPQEGGDASMVPEARIILPELLDLESGEAKSKGIERDSESDFSVKSPEGASEHDEEWEEGESPDTLEDLEPPPEAPELPTQMEDVSQPPNRKKEKSKAPDEEVQDLEELE